MKKSILFSVFFIVVLLTTTTAVAGQGGNAMPDLWSGLGDAWDWLNIIFFDEYAS